MEKISSPAPVDAVAIVRQLAAVEGIAVASVLAVEAVAVEPLAGGGAPERWTTSPALC